MILYFSKSGRSLDQNFPYFGCSKHSCFMCWHFLMAFNGIETRGCHEREIKAWTVPEVSDLAPGCADKLGMALVQLQENLRREFISEILIIIPQLNVPLAGEAKVTSDVHPNVMGWLASIGRGQMEIESARAADRSVR